jgi:hypothetical protein
VNDFATAPDDGDGNCRWCHESATVRVGDYSYCRTHGGEVLGDTLVAAVKAWPLENETE